MRLPAAEEATGSEHGATPTRAERNGGETSLLCSGGTRNAKRAGGWEGNGIVVKEAGDGSPTGGKAKPANST